jgi:hypothetical protein
MRIDEAIAKRQSAHRARLLGEDSVGRLPLLLT